MLIGSWHQLILLAEIISDLQVLDQRARRHYSTALQLRMVMDWAAARERRQHQRALAVHAVGHWTNLSLAKVGQSWHRKCSTGHPALQAL